MSARDLQGLEVTGSADAAAIYDTALDHLLRFQAEVVDDATTLGTEHPDFPLGGVLGAYLPLLSTEVGDVPDAAAAVAGIDRAKCTAREQAHLRAVDAWVGGDMAGAGRALDRLLVDDPRDVLALMVGHQIDFFSGAAHNLRDRVARSLPTFQDDDAHWGFLRGMYAFGLEECGSYERAEATGREAVDRNPDDVWGIHAVTHSHEMRGEVDLGVNFLQSRRDDWLGGNFLNVHNAWHLALFMLEVEDTDESLRIFDSVLHHNASPLIALEMLDATAMLWRLALDGVDVGDRWRGLADAWADKPERPFYAFNDMHAVMAFIGADRLADAESVVGRLERYAAEPDDGTVTNRMMTRDSGLPVCRGLVAFAREDYQEAIDQLWPIRARLHHFGGSHAQRDAVQRTLLVAALRAGDDALARALVNERLAERPASVWTWRRESDRHRALGDEDGAAAAEATAAETQARFASARA